MILEDASFFVFNQSESLMIEWPLRESDDMRTKNSKRLFLEVWVLEIKEFLPR